MSPKIVDKDLKKKEIALAALDVFAQEGFETASIRQVAEAAGIGKGTVYEYFASKEELVHAALLAWMESLAASIAGTYAEIDDPEARLRAFVRSGMETFLADGRSMRLFLRMVQLLLTEEAFFRSHALIQEMTAGFREEGKAILLDGVTRGIFAPQSAEAIEKTAINLLAYMDGIGLHYAMNPDYFDLYEQVDAYLDSLVEGLKAVPTAAEDA